MLMSFRRQYPSVLFSVGCIMTPAMCLPARADSVVGERRFMVILATSPKQYPGPMNGMPAGGWVSVGLIHQQYFDKVDPDVGSLAEYWEEVSYGDITISGDTTRRRSNSAKSR